MGNHKKLLQFLIPDPPPAAAPAAAARKPSSSSTSDSDSDGDDASYSPPTSPSTSTSAATSAAASPFAMSPWTQLPGLGAADGTDAGNLLPPGRTTGLLGSLVKAEGHVYSLAAAGDLLYTGTDSRNVRVWRDRREQGGFTSSSGLVKAIVVAADGRIFTGHQDGKVRVWRRRHDEEGTAKAELEGVVRHRRVGSLPRPRDVVASALLPSRYVRTRRKRSALWLRHFDAVSCLSLDPAAGLLYSGSWDKTVKVWRVADSRCLESFPAHHDAVNAVAAAGFDALLFTGSADGTVKVWRRELEGRRTRHVMERVLREGDGAVTAIAVSVEARVVYVGTSDGAVTHWQFPRRGGGSSAAQRCAGTAGTWRCCAWPWRGAWWRAGPPIAPSACGGAWTAPRTRASPCSAGTRGPSSASPSTRRKRRTRRERNGGGWCTAAASTGPSRSGASRPTAAAEARAMTRR